VPADPALGPPLCPEHFAIVSKQGHYGGHDYTARGAVETNGYNSFLKRADYPEMQTMHLWPTVEVDGVEEDYSHEQRHVPIPNPNLYPSPSPSPSSSPSPNPNPKPQPQPLPSLVHHPHRWYDRNDWISRSADTQHARYPSMAFVNTQHKLPQMFQLPRGDCKPLGDFAGSVKLPPSAVSGPPRTFAAVIERFNAAPRDPSECVYLWKLLEAACEHTGAPLSKPVLAERADAKGSYRAFQETLKARRGAAKARDGPELRALLAGLGEVECRQLLQRLQVT